MISSVIKCSPAVVQVQLVVVLAGAFCRFPVALVVLTANQQKHQTIPLVNDAATLCSKYPEVKPAQSHQKTLK